MCIRDRACEGVVNAENFDAVADLCLQFAAIESEKPGGKRFANEHSKKLYERFLQKKEAYRRARSQKPNPDYQLGLSLIHISLMERRGSGSVYILQRMYFFITDLIFLK